MEDTSSKRRRFFKRAGLATLAGVLAGAIGFKAFGHGGRGWRGGEALDPAQMEERLDRMLKHLYVEIDATDEQKRRIEPIVKDAARELMPLRAKAREGRQRALELLSAPVIDRQAIERLRAEHLQLAEQGSKRLARALGDLSEVLTPEQRQTLAQRFEQHGGWHHGHAS